MHELVIYGSGGHAREIAQLVDDVNAARPTWSFLGFLDDDAARHGMTLGGGRVLGGGDWLRSRSSVAVTVAIGNSVHRRRVVSALHGARFATLIHPRASIGARVSIGTGSMVCAGAVITCDVQLGSHVIVNVGSTVSHDCVLDDFVTLAPRVSLAGGTRVGTGSDMGIGSTTIQSVTVGEWSIIGAGASLTTHVPANVTTVGVPSRVIKVRDPGWHDL